MLYNCSAAMKIISKYHQICIKFINLTPKYSIRSFEKNSNLYILSVNQSYILL